MKRFLHISLLLLMICSCSEEKSSTTQDSNPEIEETYIINKLTGDTLQSGIALPFDTVGIPFEKTQKLLAREKIHDALWEKQERKSNQFTLSKLATRPFLIDSSENFAPDVCDSLPPKKLKIEPFITLLKEPENQEVSAASYSDNAQYDIQNLGMDEGLPTNTIMDMKKDAEGNVWMASDKGLIRYDGLSIKTYNQDAGLPENHLICIDFDAESNVWMGTRSKGFVKFDGDHFYHYPIDSISLNRQVSSIAFDQNGVMWSAVQFGGFVSFDGDYFYLYQEDQGIKASRPTTSVAIDKNNVKWGTAYYYGLYSFEDDGTVRRWHNKHASPLSTYINHVFIDSKGRAVYSHWGRNFSVVDGDSVSRYEMNVTLLPELIIEMTEDGEGNYWVAGNGAGIFKVNIDDMTVEHFGEEHGLSSNYVTSIFVDDDGLVWTATEGGGLSCYRPHSFHNLNKYNGLENHIVYEVTEKEDQFYYSTNRGLYRSDTSGMYYFKGSLDSPKSKTWQTTYDNVVDANGNLWILAMNAGVSRIASDGTWIRMGGSSYGVDHNPTCLDTSVNGDVWIGGLNSSLSHLNDTTCFQYGYANGLAIRDLSDLLITDEDVIWIGSQKTGIAKLYKDSITYYTTKEGLCSNVIHDLKEDRSGRLWISTELGVNYVENGVIGKLNHPLLQTNTKGTIQDNSGRYWIAGESKLFVLVPKNEVSTEWNEEEYQLKTFDNKNGLSNTGFIANSIFINSENTLMVGSAQGLVQLPLDELTFNEEPPVCYLQSIGVNGIHLDFRALKEGQSVDTLHNSNQITFDQIGKFNNVPEGLVVPHNLNHITFKYSGMNWNDPSGLKFQYYLEGYEENWNLGRSNNLAEYRNLDFGKYTFHLKAINRDGIESSEYTLAFEIERPWWRTWWAITLLALLILICIFGIVKWRTKELRKRQLILENEIEQATTKIRAQKELVEAQKADVEQAHEELNTKNQEILDSINYAKRIQNAILPPDTLIDELLSDNFVYYLPKDIVAGDFYWLEPTADGVLFAAADCTGHGVPGAMVSVICNNSLNRTVREFEITDPGKILDKTRDLVIEEFMKSDEDVKDGMDIAICHLQTTKDGAILKYAGANNPLWVVRKGETELEEIKPDKQPIGVFDVPQPFTTHTVQLNKGDTFYIFSDGYADQFGGDKGKKMKTANFKKSLLEIQDKDMKAQLKMVADNFERWKGEFEQLDDVCVIGVRV